MTNRFYSSADAVAPVLTGQVGSLAALLDAVLVNGYGTQPAAGWTIAFTGTNERVYTMGAGGTGFSMFLNDNAPVDPREATVVGYQVATGIGTGTAPWPTPVQMAAGLTQGVPWRKSETADAVARKWYVLADANTVYVIVQTGFNVIGNFGWMGYIFGDLGGTSANDDFACLLMDNRGYNPENSGTPTELLNFGLCGVGVTDVESTGQWLAASAAGVPTSVPAGKLFDSAIMGYCQGQQNGNQPGGGAIGFGANWANTLAFPAPNNADGSIYMSPIRINSGNGIRGHLKGLWAPLHHLPLNDGDTFTVATGNLAGKSFMAVTTFLTSTNFGSYAGIGQIFIETSDTWN